MTNFWKREGERSTNEHENKYTRGKNRNIMGTSYPMYK